MDGLLVHQVAPFGDARFALTWQRKIGANAQFHSNGVIR